MNELTNDEINEKFRALSREIEENKRQYDTLRTLFYKNRFSDTIVFDERLACNSRVGLKDLSADPLAGEVGDLVSVGGKLKICTTASQTAATYTIVGTQS